MKKILSLALCAMMIFTAVSTVFAAEENIYAPDFSTKNLGPLATSVDAYALHSTPKEGKIEFIDFQGKRVLSISHVDSGNSYGVFSQFLYNNAEGVAKWGAKNQFVLEYDLYIASTSDAMIFTLGTGSGQGETGTAWIEPALIKGSDLGLYISGTKEAVTHLKLKTWYKIAVTFDLDKQTNSVYVDGKAYAKDLPFATKTVGNLVKFVRVSYAKNFKGESTAYINNVKIYNAADARPYTPAAPQTFDAAIALAVVSVVSASGVIVSKKRK